MIDIILKIGPVIAFIYAMFSGWQHYEQWKTVTRVGLVNQIAKKEESLKLKKAEVRRGERFKEERDQRLQELNQLISKLSEVSKMLPSRGPKMPKILRELADLTDKTGLDFESILPQSVRQKEFLNEIPMKIKVKGTYLQIMSFLDLVASMERIMTAEKVTLDQPTIKGTDKVVTAEIELVAYHMAKSFNKEQKQN